MTFYKVLVFVLLLFWNCVAISDMSLINSAIAKFDKSIFSEGMRQTTYEKLNILPLWRDGKGVVMYEFVIDLSSGGGRYSNTRALLTPFSVTQMGLYGDCVTNYATDIVGVNIDMNCRTNGVASCIVEMSQLYRNKTCEESAFARLGLVKHTSRFDFGIQLNKEDEFAVCESRATPDESFIGVIVQTIKKEE